MVYRFFLAMVQGSFVFWAALEDLVPQYKGFTSHITQGELALSLYNQTYSFYF